MAGLALKGRKVVWRIASEPAAAVALRDMRADSLTGSFVLLQPARPRRRAHDSPMRLRGFPHPIQKENREREFDGSRR
jgi:hypothetical protein